MGLATVIWAGKDWLWPALGAFGLLTLFIFWSYRSSSMPAGMRWGCALLKGLAGALILACLLDPLWSRQRARPGANDFVLLADNSQGMQIKDPGSRISRGEQMHDLLRSGKEGWEGTLSETFQVRNYLFDSTLQLAASFESLDFQGRSSAIGRALQSLAQRYQGRPLAGILLFSDGNATDLEAGLGDLPQLPPVYVVPIGKDAPVSDISLQRLTVSQSSFEDAPVSIQAAAVVDGFSSTPISAELIELVPNVETNAPSSDSPQTGDAATNGSEAATNAPPPAFHPGGYREKQMEKRSLRPAPDGGRVETRFQARPTAGQVAFFRVRMTPGTTNPPEATEANNQRLVAVDRGGGPYRILFVGGRPSWEFKFLNRSVSEDSQIQLVALIRAAPREPKYDFKGRAGESSNPLFRGFNDPDSERERYDQPVLVRLNVADQSELKTGFPKTEEDLYRYDAVILDDVESSFFTRDQLALLQRFVSERGGGFLMLGGVGSFEDGHYETTPVGQMLPVYLRQEMNRQPLPPLRLNLTREGWVQPWARLRSTESEERERLSNLPYFDVANIAVGIKPGASTIATLSDPSGRLYPGLVVQRFGYGRSAALMAGDFWLSGFRDESMQKDLGKAWRQLIRWLVADVPRRVELRSVPQPGDPNQAVELQVKVRDASFHPLDNANVRLTVHPIFETNAPPAGDREGVRLEPEPALSEAGVYKTTYIPRQAGGYLVEAQVRDAEGREVGHAQTGWTSQPAAEEFRSLRPNRALLQEIAQRTGGTLLSPDDLSDWAAKLPQKAAPITEEWRLPLWHQSWVFLLALLLLAAEWGWRRSKGLA